MNKHLGLFYSQLYNTEARKVLSTSKHWCAFILYLWSKTYLLIRRLATWK